eukprot:353608-Chlamydomonas_euryale.AAC.3
MDCCDVEVEAPQFQVFNTCFPSKVHGVGIVQPHSIEGWVLQCLLQVRRIRRLDVVNRLRAALGDP